MSQTTVSQQSPPATLPDLPNRPIRYDEFLEWVEDEIRAEWVGGEVILLSPPTSRHQDVVRFLTMLLGTWVEHRASGRVLPSPFQMKLEERGREPDVIYLSAEHADRLLETHLDGPADLAVEVVSSTSGPRDRGEKFYEYESAGVREYLLVDPEREDVVLFRLGADGKYHTAFEGETGRIESTVLDGLWLQAEWFWQDELPQTFDVYRHWGLIE
jgi:Uma2 family endonuclease